MMTLNSMYWLVNLWALTGWALLLLYAVLPARVVLFAGICMPLGLSLAYLGAVCLALPYFSGGFGSLDALAGLYGHPQAVLAGWVHYLAFDLFLGGWQVRKAQAARLPVALVIPCLLLTMVFGPVGLLLFYALRWRWQEVPGTPIGQTSNPS